MTAGECHGAQATPKTREEPAPGPRPGASAVARLGERPPGWAGYAAFGWAVAYALGVRLYQALGGTAGLAGTFEDPEGMRRASLSWLTVAGVLLLSAIACATVVLRSV